MAEYRVAADPGHYLEYGDPVAPGQAFSYTVAAVGRDGRLSTPTAPVGIFASSQALRPVVQLSLQDEATPLDPRIVARYGVRGEPGFADGVMDDIRIYEATLPPQEVEAVFKTSQSAFEKSATQ